jgi:hypothetical protein
MGGGDDPRSATLRPYCASEAPIKMTDGELFYIITNGRGKMTGAEGDRTKEEVRWNLVDVREESEWAQGHLPGAIPLGKGIIERDIE